MRTRRDKRPIFILIGVFVAAFSFALLLNQNKQETADAADLSKFEPGNIISDYVMSNYDSMTEAEIQAFLTAKNPCNNTDYGYYQYLTNLNGEIWHWKDNHFVCISEEKFGEGTDIGEGETAAHIIYSIAQSQKINPQVLLVLLEKESSLISDKIPNFYDYRKAVGYGCYDSEATCRSEFYGFKNQLTRAAKLFREVLDGGWTNYPLGENYIQYNPDTSCGGTIVNIQNLATSSLYRYTPYQPNAAALAAGYGQGDYCSAYGNRNFYQMFYDWFGDPTVANIIEWVNSTNPRYMTTTEKTQVYNFAKKTWEPYKKVDTLFFNQKTTIDNKLCLRVSNNEKDDICFMFDDLKNYEPIWEPSSTPRYLKIEKATPISTLTLKTVEHDSQQDVIFFNTKTLLPNGKTCVRNESMDKDVCYLFPLLSETSQASYWQNADVPRLMKSDGDARQLDVVTGEVTNIEDAFISFYSTKIYTPLGLCTRKYDDSQENNNICIVIADLENVPGGSWVPSVTPRTLLSAKEEVTYISLSTLQATDIAAKPAYWYNQKIQLPDNETCVRNSKDDINSCVMMKELSEEK